MTPSCLPKSGFSQLESIFGRFRFRLNSGPNMSSQLQIFSEIQLSDVGEKKAFFFPEVDRLGTEPLSHKKLADPKNGAVRLNPLRTTS